MSAELETIEETLDQVVRVNVIKSFFSQKSTQIGVAALAAAGLGVATGWFVANKKLQTKYEMMLEEELEKSRQFLYDQNLKLEKEREFSDPEAMLAQVASEVSDAEARTDAALDQASTMTVDYSKMFTGDAPDQAVRVPDEENEFLKKQPTPDIEIEESSVVVQRKLLEEKELTQVELDSYEAYNIQLIEDGQPHIISAEDFNENETEWEQVTITWFAGDGVLVDEREQMIDDVEGVVGLNNMDRFGYLSGDKNILYIRNSEKELELEVVHSDGNYAQDVLGFMHSDETFQRRQRRSRLGDDG